MYKCRNCKAVFECTQIFKEKPNRVPSPFGSGYIDEGGGEWEGCPECEGTDFDEVEFDGFCPKCNKKVIDDSHWDYDDDLNLECPYCKHKFGVFNGEITDYIENN